MELRHDLHRAEDTLVITVKHSSERCKGSEREDLGIAEKTSPAGLFGAGKNGFDAAGSMTTAAHCCCCRCCCCLLLCVSLLFVGFGSGIAVEVASW